MLASHAFFDSLQPKELGALLILGFSNNKSHVTVPPPQQVDALI